MNTTAVVGDPNKKKRTTLWLIIGISVFVAAVGGGVGLRMLLDNSKPDTSTGIQVQPTAGNKAQDLAISGKYADAHKQISDALSKPDVSSGDKYVLYYQQGATYLNEGKIQQAIDSYKQAEAVQATHSVTKSIGDAYAQLDNKEEAIEYYKKAISLLATSNSPIAGEDKSLLEEKIRNLGGQP